MADEPRKSGDASDEKASQEETFHVDHLRRNARQLFGVSPHAVAGALSEGRKVNYSVDEAKGLVREFMKRKDTTREGDK